MSEQQELAELSIDVDKINKAKEKYYEEKKKVWE